MPYRWNVLFLYGICSGTLANLSLGHEMSERPRTNADFQWKSRRAETLLRALSIHLLGTGWQRFRFRLGSPRAAAHMWGKGARILQRTKGYHNRSSACQKKSAKAPAQVRRLVPDWNEIHLRSNPDPCLIRRSEGVIWRKNRG